MGGEDIIHAITEVRASAFTIPTDRPESDGTLEWDTTTIVVTEVGAGGVWGLGYSYAEVGAAGLVNRLLAPRVVGLDAMAVPAAWQAMVRAVRNVGRSRIEIDERTGLACGVHYMRAGRDRYQRTKAVAVAGYAIETPRLLLHSTSRRFPDGLCNDHDLVGRFVMVQGAPQTAGRFSEEVRAYKAPPPEVSSEAFYETDATRPFRRGFSIQCVSPLPVTFAEHVLAQGHWGVVAREYMRDYIHWATIGALCEFLPRPDNRVTLDAETDRHGMPVARFSYSQCDNDRELMTAATATTEAILTAAGAEEVITIARYAHLVGGARMGARPETGVVDGDLRSFAVPNLWVTDGSTLPTQGAANPALTIMAVAARAADVMVRTAGKG